MQGLHTQEVGEKMSRCECPYNEVISKEREHLYSDEEKVNGLNHKANECKCTNNLKQYIRCGKIIWLCSKCHMFGDKEVEGQDKVIK